MLIKIKLSLFHALQFLLHLLTMQLETYISDLLYRYDCVTIPELGALLTKRQSAIIDEATATFYPPKKVISFNEQLQQSDGLLISYISEVEKIPFSTAAEKVQKYVRSIKSYLVEGETITFKNIGDMVLNSEGKIIFQPAYHINYLTDSFGLDHLKQPEVLRETLNREVEEIEKVIPISVSNTKANRVLKYAAVAVIALTLGIVGAGAYMNQQIADHNKMAQEQANETIEQNIQEATFIIDNPLPSATVKLEKQTGKYHIVAGAFRVEENADNSVKQLRAEGFKARILGINKYGLHEVVYESFEERTEAIKALRDIRRNHNSSAWMLVRDQN